MIKNEDEQTIDIDSMSDDFGANSNDTFSHKKRNLQKN